MQIALDLHLQNTEIVKYLIRGQKTRPHAYRTPAKGLVRYMARHYNSWCWLASVYYSIANFHKISKYVKSPNCTFWHKNGAQYMSKLSTLYISLNSLWLSWFLKNTLKIGQTDLEIWSNYPKSVEILTFWPIKSCSRWVKIANSLYQS